MTFTRNIRVLAATAALLTPVTLFGTTAQAETAAPLGKPQVEQIVREYLLNNPEILLEVQDALEKKQREEQKLAQQTVMKDRQEQLFNSPYDGVVGNPDAAITVVEFFDYNCGYCKRAMTDMQALVEENDDVRFVLKEFPILSAQSREAHVVSMAVHAIAPEKYADFHQKLLGAETRADGELAMKIATETGIDEAALRKEMENPEIQKVFAETYDLANQLAVTGTPAYVIGDEVVFGALGKDVLAEKIDQARTQSN
ncbi:DsbA family protein [Nitratireductor aquibiodomus]|uniref:Protein-disulfide isomerase n=1 Tax=Nitratireductor aquibiodomus TaxID=204799 RepID=A0A1H4IT41_9HYPH|nr:DsbA family protein [Nitratireductor aquibiodomus]SEB37187.1 Protein-disulfide isomerase [Nitratireductor aquibiodomus]